MIQMVGYAASARRFRRPHLSVVRKYTGWHTLLLLLAFLGLNPVARLIFGRRRRLLYREVDPKGRVVRLVWTKPRKPIA